MKRWRVAAVAALAVVALAVGGAFFGTASADPSPDISSCQNGGWSSLIDPATGTTFTSEGRCVSVYARPVPIVPQVTVGTWGFQVISQAPWCQASATMSGTASTAYPVTWLADGLVVGTETVSTDGSGAATVTHAFDEGVAAELVVDDQTFTLPSIDCSLDPTTFVGARWPVTGSGCGAAFVLSGEPGTEHTFQLTQNSFPTNKGTIFWSGTFTPDSTGYTAVSTDLNGSGPVGHLWIDGQYVQQMTGSGCVTIGNVVSLTNLDTTGGDISFTLVGPASDHFTWEVRFPNGETANQSGVIHTDGSGNASLDLGTSVPTGTAFQVYVDSAHLHSYTV
jgi:hypothetical protein